MKVTKEDLRIGGRLIRMARIEGEKYVFLDDPPRFIEAVRECGIRIDLFTFMQRLPHTTPEYEYYMEWDNLAALPVSTFEHWWNNQINNKTRNILRRSRKAGVTTREVAFSDELIAGVQQIYNECPVRQGRPFAHYGKTFGEIRRMKATFLAQSVFIGAYFDSTLIGFAKLVADTNRGQAGLMHIVSTIGHRDMAPTNALIAQAVASCAERRIPYLVYSNFAYGKKQRDSLAEFKQHNGFERVELPRYYVPLTVAGLWGLRFRMHHGIRDFVPEPIGSRLRILRRRWNNWRLAMKRTPL